MKILKKGKAPATWLFRCEDCGCEFLANESDREYDREGDSLDAYYLPRS